MKSPADRWPIHPATCGGAIAMGIYLISSARCGVAVEGRAENKR